MCGEERVTPYSFPRSHGSPPHVRGRGRYEAGKLNPKRITPACAGKRRSPVGAGAQSGDHPRMCGEEAVVKPSVQSLTGSPPHVRGRVRHTGGIQHGQGITPACAGKRLSG